MCSSIKVSIVTVCYNSEKTIKHTIESVLHQTYENIEYIIVDGASTDKTVGIVKEYKDSFNGRLRWISEPDQGIYYAMNKGIDMATGDLIGIINSDDYYELDAVMSVVNAMGSERYQIIYGLLRTLEHGKEVAITLNNHEFLERNMIAHPACFVTKKVYQDLGKYNTKYVSAADYEFMLRMKQNKEVHFEPVYKLIANFSTGGMCSTEKAYMDLIKLQKDYCIIPYTKYFRAQLRHLFWKVLGK